MSRFHLTTAVCGLIALQTACAVAQTKPEDKIAVYEKAIEALQSQIDQLKKDIAGLRKAQEAKKPDSTSERAQVFGFLQSQYESTSGQGQSRFFVRRARVGVHGKLDHGFSYEIHTNLDDTRGILRNAWIDYTSPSGTLLTPVVRFGQFKLPYTLEALKDTGATTPFVERALAVDQMGFNHDRDSGIALYSRRDEHHQRPFEYFLSLTNGAGRNQFAATSSKLFSGRLQLNSTQDHSLFGGNIAVGFSTRQGEVKNLNLATDVQQENERYGVDLEYIRQKLRIRGEYLWGRNQARHPEGYYGLLGYQVSNPLEMLLRYEGYSSDTPGPSAHRTTIGLTYRFSPSVQALLNYEFLDGTAPGNTSSGLRVRVQTLFP